MRLTAVAILTALTVGCVLACASTETQSSTYKSPLSRGREFRKVAVWSKAGLAARQQTEGWAAAALRQHRVDAVSSLSIWPIDASEAEIQSRLTANSIDAVLVLALQTVSTSSEVRTTSTTLFASPEMTTTQTSTANKLNVTFSATLFNEGTQRVAWQSQASTAGGWGSSWDDINASFVEKTVNDLMTAKVLYFCLPKPPKDGPPELGPSPGPDASDAMKRRYAARLQAAGVPLEPASPEECPPRGATKPATTVMRDEWLR